MYVYVYIYSYYTITMLKDEEQVGPDDRLLGLRRRQLRPRGRLPGPQAAFLPTKCLSCLQTSQRASYDSLNCL